MFHRGFLAVLPCYSADKTLNYSCEYERINIHGEKGSVVETYMVVCSLQDETADEMKIIKTIFFFGVVLSISRCE
jgi:hypothetical protein